MCLRTCLMREPGVVTTLAMLFVGGQVAAQTIFPISQSRTVSNENVNAPQCSGDLLGDLDEDRTVGILDFLLLLAAWGPCDVPCPPTCSADLDNDCIVGITDFLLLLRNWG